VNVKFIFQASILAVVIFAIGLFYFHSLPAIVIAVGTPVRQDDFSYTVTRVVKHRDKENIAYEVTIRVDNHAKVVDYQWRDAIASVTDSAGRQYRALPDQRDGSDRPPIAAGDSAQYTLTYMLPATAQRPMMQYSNGILMGDVFDGAAYRRAAIPL
jgi:hypothetical protein